MEMVCSFLSYSTIRQLNKNEKNSSLFFCDVILQDWGPYGQLLNYSEPSGNDIC